MHIRALVYEKERSNLLSLLTNDNDFFILDYLNKKQRVIEQVDLLIPDVIILNVASCDEQTSKMIELIKGNHPFIKVIIITRTNDFSSMVKAMKSGVQGYLIASIDHTFWLDYLKSVVLETEINKQLTRMLYFKLRLDEEETEKKEPLISLRETEVVKLVALGYSNKEIARELEIEIATVKNHLKSIFQKLHVKNRVQLTRYAIKTRLVEL